jgi:hypothetical protein
MEAHPAIGDFYRQEFDLGDAEDFAEVILLENKFYAAGVGNLLTIDATTGERVELVQITTE